MKASTTGAHMPYITAARIVAVMDLIIRARIEPRRDVVPARLVPQDHYATGWNAALDMVASTIDPDLIAEAYDAYDGELAGRGEG